MKILCLVVDSDPSEAWRETYASHRHLWTLAFAIMPVDGFFVRSDPNPDIEYLLDRGRRTLKIRGEESFVTMTHKIVCAIEILLEDHDYVVKTNLSSLYDFDALRAHLGLPTEGLYEGHFVEGSYPSGAGIVMSADVARMLCASYREHGNQSEWDDVSIHRLLREKNISPRHKEMFIFNYAKDLDAQISQVRRGGCACYRFRDYDDPHRVLERKAAEAVFRKIYAADGG